MFRVSLAPQFVGREVLLKGWLHNKRSSGKIRFLIVRDGSGFMQAVMVKGEVPDEDFELFDELEQECALEVRGVVREEPRAPGGYELAVKGLKKLAPSPDYPIKKIGKGEKPPEVGWLLARRHLWIRSRKQWAILRVRAEVERAMIDFLDSEGFTRFDAPILTGASVEGTTTLFELDYFGRPAYLSQSGQLYAEAGAYALGKVYTFGPSFRAEKSKTRRHLTEFWHVEPEAAFWELPDLLDFLEKFITYVVQRVLERRREELKILERDTKPLEKVEPPFPRITYDEAVRLLREKGFEFEWGDDFGGDEETAISESFDKPVMVTHYPANIKPFYMRREGGRALCVDVLAPEGYGEIVGGSQREHRYEVLLKQIREAGLPEEAYRWYLDLRKYGGVPTSGFGIGVERTVAWITGIHHVREAIPFPRTIERLEP